MGKEVNVTEVTDSITMGMNVISETDATLNMVREFRKSLTDAQKNIFNAGLIGRLVAHLPVDVARRACQACITTWECQHLDGPKTCHISEYYSNREEIREQI